MKINKVEQSRKITHLINEATERDFAGSFFAEDVCKKIEKNRAIEELFEGTNGRIVVPINTLDTKQELLDSSIVDLPNIPYDSLSSMLYTFYELTQALSSGVARNRHLKTPEYYSKTHLTISLFTASMKLSERAVLYYYNEEENTLSREEFPKGMRASKVIRKCAKLVKRNNGFPSPLNDNKGLDADEWERDMLRHLEQVQTDVSIEIQKVSAYGNLVFSVLPEDIATISMNDNCWSSCLDLFEGEYANGALSLLGSGQAIVVYIESGNSDYKVGNEAYSNKIWRRVGFIEGSEIFFQKAYPSTSEVFDQLVVKALSARGYAQVSDERCYIENNGYCSYYLDSNMGDLNFSLDLEQYEFFIESQCEFPCGICGGQVEDDMDLLCCECEGTFICGGCGMRCDKSEAHHSESDGFSMFTCDECYMS